MKVLTKQYYGYKFTNLIGINTLQIVFDFITYSIVSNNTNPFVPNTPFSTS